MISGWVVKLVIAIALAAFALFEIGSPVITRVQLDDGLHQAADDAAQTFFSTHNADQAKATAQQDADSKNFKLLDFSVDPQGQTHLKGEKKAKGLLFDRWDKTKRYYEVTETVTGRYNNS